MPRQIWRTLLVRVVIFHATRGMIGRLCELADQVPAVRKALIELDEAAEEIATQDGDEATAVSRVVEAWCAALGRAMRRRTLPPAARELFRQMRDRLHDGVCSEDPFVGILRNIEVQARILYGDAWRPTELTVRHLNRHPRRTDPAADPYPMTAALIWPPAPDGAKIILRICPATFGPAAYAAIHMVLTHECVCHVPARQAEAKADSAFAEGLLDWVAYHFLDAWALKLDRDCGPTLRKHADELRTVLMRDRSTRAGIARHVGHDAASNLQAWFEHRLALAPADARVWVAQLAVELNLVDRPLEIKDNLVSRLSWPLPPDLDAALRSWADHDMPTEKLLDMSPVEAP
jgi:hypothetical protein